MPSVFLNSNVNATGSYRYDTFGRRKDILSGSNETYNSIFGKNTASGSKSTLSLLSSITELGSDLKDAVKAFKGNSNVFNQRKAESANADVLSIDKSKVTSAYTSDKLEVTVKQLAQAQENKGAALDSQAKSQARTGTNKVAVEVNGKNTYFDVTVGANDTNSQVQQKLADKINASKTGLNASVVYDEERGTSSLVIKGNNTGANNTFSIRDVEGSIVNETGASNKVQNAQDAQYSINDGYTRTSSSNTVDLGSGVTGTLKKVSSDPVKVNFSKDTEDIISKVGDLVQSFNDALSGAGSSSKLANQLSGASKTYSASLSRVGISVGKEGYLTIDSDKLKSAAESGSLEKVIGSGGGFTNRLDQIAQKAEKNPGTFVDYKAQASSPTGSYSKNFYQLMNSYNAVGMLFDSYI